MNTIADLENARRHLGLKAYQMAELLRISPEWYSKLVKRGGELTEDFQLRFDDVVRRNALKLDSSGFKISAALLPLPHTGKQYVQAVEEGPGSSNAKHELEREIREKFEKLLAAADGNIGRLGWISEQMRQHLSEPIHWGMKERVMREVLEEAARKRASRTSQDEAAV